MAEHDDTSRPAMSGAQGTARPGSPGGPGGGGPAGGHGGPGMGARGMIGSGARSRNFRASFKRLVGLLRPYTARIVLVLVLAIVSVTLSTAGPRILGHATNLLFEGVVSAQMPEGASKAEVIQGLEARGEDKLAQMLENMNVTPGKGVDFEGLGRILIGLIFIYIGSSFFAWLQQYLTAGISQGMVYHLRGDVDAKLTRLPLKYFDDHARGDILSRVTNDIDNIAQSLQQALTQITTSILRVAGVLIMMFVISPLLASISVLTVPLSVLVTMQIAKRSQKHFSAQWEHTGTLNGHVEEVHTGRAVVKAFGRQTETERVFAGENEKLYQASFRAQFISGIIQPSMDFLGNVNYVFIAVIGGLRVASGTITLGDVQAFIQYQRQFTWPITQLASMANVLQSAIASAERVFELLDEPEQSPDTATPVHLAHAEGRVQFEDVSFRYREDEPLIEHLNLTVEPGQTVAIVGPTGAGKTTLVNLLLRFYEIDGGRITVDGVDTRNMTREDVRGLFGMVLQDAWLFGGTIGENIAYGKEDATDAEIVAAAEAAHIDHYIRTLPEGYETRVDNEATSVSQGEKQLLTIARAFLSDPEILILDEATSSVDTRTEVLIQRAMAKLMKSRTSFVIAHRLSTIRDADVIIVMDHGRIIETGTHEELLAAGGFYADLYNSQFEEALIA